MSGYQPCWHLETRNVLRTALQQGLTHSKGHEVLFRRQCTAAIGKGLSISSESYKINPSIGRRFSKT
jgi:hypothetical protein